MNRCLSMAIVLLWSFIVVKYDGRGRARWGFRKLRPRDLVDVNWMVTRRRETQATTMAIRATFEMGSAATGNVIIVQADSIQNVVVHGTVVV